MTNDFFSYIPHDFGFSHMSSFILDTEQKVKQKIEMLESLSEIKIATTILSQASSD
jgi:poly [ADP-ribose] polymerase